ncbi:hypothetical protein E2C01_016160 [Portunus trituberculatus]|uniref:Uncharacterized protein n=1 Tax=Portunus trituberculatus TaxID=210409 RepID=A0A5B7DNB8_PORTR|nr:hypothetical protein [Portunus trituberculatus]
MAWRGELEVLDLLGKFLVRPFTPFPFCGREAGLRFTARVKHLILRSESVKVVLAGKPAAAAVAAAITASLLYLSDPEKSTAARATHTAKIIGGVGGSRILKELDLDSLERTTTTWSRSHATRSKGKDVEVKGILNTEDLDTPQSTTATVHEKDR